MPFISVTRLRIRSVRFMPSFAMHTLRSIQQVKKTPGFQGGSVLVDRRWTFWTMTTWDCQDSMRQFMTQGPHRAAMPNLLDWCDEASVVHWDQPEDGLPAWIEADQRMREGGRPSKVNFPTSGHATLGYPPPRATTAGLIRPAKTQAE
jgi:hypothetical protein